MDFLKKHYEKIILCVVLLCLAAAVLWMNSATKKAKEGAHDSTAGRAPKTAPPEAFDLTPYQQALAQITNPPTVLLAGEHNLFNPVTWKRKANGDLLKIVKSGPDALVVTGITPLYTVISFERPMEGSIYVMNVQSNVPDPNQPSLHAKSLYPHKDEKNKGWPFIVRGIKGAENDPSEVNLEILETGDTNVWVSTNHPYKHVQSYYADLKYDPETLTLLKRKVKEEFNLDNDPYIIVEITNDAVRVQSRRTTKVTEIRWTKSPKGD